MRVNTLRVSEGHCGEENSLKRFTANSVSSAKNSVSSLSHTNNRLRQNSLSSNYPGTQLSPKKLTEFGV